MSSAVVRTSAWDGAAWFEARRIVAAWFEARRIVDAWFEARPIVGASMMGLHNLAAWMTEASGIAVSGLAGAFGIAVSGLAGAFGRAVSGLAGAFGRAVSGLAGAFGRASGRASGRARLSEALRSAPRYDACGRPASGCRGAFF